jgi:hypothetical protein
MNTYPGTRMSEDDNLWKPYSNGSTLGKQGSEDGITLVDEELQGIARITLEEIPQRSRFAITCGIQGWLVHTRYAAAHSEALCDYKLMKTELAKLVQLVNENTSLETVLKVIKQGV